MNVIKQIEGLMTKDDLEQLNDIFEPFEVATPIVDAMDNLCVAPNGQIRYYKNIDDKRIYQYSNDGGLSWKINNNVSSRAMGKCFYFEKCDLYFKPVVVENENHIIEQLRGRENGTYALISKIGPDDENFEVYKINDYIPEACMMRSAIYIESENRILATSQIYPDYKIKTIMFYSDDFGKTWETVVLDPLPKKPIEFPDKANRWDDNNAEGTFIEYKNGDIECITRTSYNFHYSYISKDHGKTWSEPLQTNFHSTITMPLLKRLSNGAIMFLWCNTQPLPEYEPEKAILPLSDWEINGIQEVVFTNRDANHAAISFDEGKTWQGFREMALNPIRNNSDFRTIGTLGEYLDKSIHQFELLELPLGKVLVVYGQNSQCRKMIIFDPKWLLEKSRKEDFLYGCKNVSTQVYLKSISGVIRGATPGHCSWNRTNGAVKVADPIGDYTEAMFLTKLDDDRLYSKKQGLVWNFPAHKSGSVEIKAYIDKYGLRLSLTDRWLNPIDEQIENDAQVTFVLNEKVCKTNEWVNVKINYNENDFEVLINDKKVLFENTKNETIFGLSYLHILSMEEEYNKGSYIKEISFIGK